MTVLSIIKKGKGKVRVLTIHFDHGPNERNENPENSQGDRKKKGEGTLNMSEFNTEPPDSVHGRKKKGEEVLKKRRRSIVLRSEKKRVANFQRKKKRKG